MFWLQKIHWALTLSDQLKIFLLRLKVLQKNLFIHSWRSWNWVYPQLACTTLTENYPFKNSSDAWIKVGKSWTVGVVLETFPSCVFFRNDVLNSSLIVKFNTIISFPLELSESLLCSFSNGWSSRRQYQIRTWNAVIIVLKYDRKFNQKKSSCSKRQDAHLADIVFPLLIV